MIPKIIWQTHEPEFAALPMNYIINSRTIANKFHDWEYKYVSAEGRDSFVKSFFPEYYQYYSKIQHPIVQADFWRYLVLYEFGGMYCDIDSIYDVAIEHMVDKIDFTKDFYAISRDISLMDKNGLTNNSHIICSEKNLVMKQIIEEMIERFKRSNQAGQYLHTHYLQEIKNSEIEKVEEDPQVTVEEESPINPYGFLGKR